MPAIGRRYGFQAKKRSKRFSAASTLVSCDVSYTFRYFGLDFFILGEAAFLELGEREFAVDGDFKTSAAGGNQREAIDVLLEFSQQPVRQTDGLVFVTSSRAVFDVDSGHAAPP